MKFSLTVPPVGSKVVFIQPNSAGRNFAVVLHPHPQFGGTMNNQIVYNTYYNFAERGFSVLRF